MITGTAHRGVAPERQYSCGHHHTTCQKRVESGEQTRSVSCDGRLQPKVEDSLALSRPGSPSGDWRWIGASTRYSCFRLLRASLHVLYVGNSNLGGWAGASPWMLNATTCANFRPITPIDSVMPRLRVITARHLFGPHATRSNAMMASAVGDPRGSTSVGIGLHMAFQRIVASDEGWHCRIVAARLSTTPH